MVVILISIQSVPPPSSASSPVDIDRVELTRRLFQAHMRLYGTANAYGSGGRTLRDLVINAEVIGWREKNPAANAKQLLTHIVSVEQALDSKLKADDLERPWYEALVRICDTLTELEKVGVVFAGVKNLIEATMAEAVQKYGQKLDQITGAMQSYGWQQQYWTIQEAIWGAVHRLGETDNELTQAWDGHFGTRYAVGLRWTVEQLLANPEIAAWVNTETLIALASNNEKYIEEAKRQILEALQKMEKNRQDGIKKLTDASAAHELEPGSSVPSQADYDKAVREAQDYQRIVNAAAAGIYILSTLVGFADRKLGRDIALLGGAAVTIASAVIAYYPTVIAAGAAGGPIALGAVVLIAAIVSAIVSLLPIFSEEQPSEVAVGVNAIRTDIANLGEYLASRFDRIDRALTALYADMMTEFQKLSLDNVRVREQLQEIEHRLIGIESKVDFYGRAVLLALGDVELKDFRGSVNKYINYKETFGSEIPTYAEYVTAENEFHLAATQLARDDAFVAASGYDSTEPVTMLDAWGAEGSISYLTWLAKKWHPSGAFSDALVVNPTVWYLASRAYETLELQNPSYARMVSRARTAEIRDAGERILAATRAFSAPLAQEDAAGRYTNPLFAGQINDYRSRLETFAAEVAAAKAKVLDGKTFDPFGASDQPVPLGALQVEPTQIQTCGGGWPQIATPLNMRLSQLPGSVRFARYLDDSAELGICYEATYIDQKTVVKPKSEQHTGRLQMTVRTRYRTSADWVDIRTATAVVGEYTCGEYTGGGPNGPAPRGQCPPDLRTLVDRWESSGYKQRFEQATPTADATKVEQVETRTSQILHGRQLRLYQNVVESLAGRGSLGLAGQQLAESVRLMQAYTQLGFPRALASDALLSGLLFGLKNLPADLGRERHIAGTYTTAVGVYANCKPVAPDGSCGYGTSVPSFDPLKGQAYLDRTCQLANLPPDVPRNDPVTDCLLAAAFTRVAELESRYAVYSLRLAKHQYEESFPAVSASVTSVELTHRLVTGEGAADGGNDPGAREYFVQRGDTLRKIAKLFFETETRWELIYASNLSTVGPDPSVLAVGMQLYIPPLVLYRVVKGDTLWRIAEDHLGAGPKWPTLYLANRTLVGPSPDLLSVDVELALPLT